MNTKIIRCRDLMVGDWCCDRHGFPMRITNVGDDYAYATFEGNEGDPWEFDDKDDQPCAIEITPEILKNNGWKEQEYTALPSEHFYVKNESGKHFLWSYGMLSLRFISDEINYRRCPDMEIPVKYVHQLQQVLRIAGLTDMANNFKV